MTSATRLQEQATQEWQQRRFEEAIASLKRAAKAEPRNLDILLDLGSSCGLRCHFDAAIRYFEEAFKKTTAEQRKEMSGVIGMRCHAFSRYDLAIQYLTRAADLPRFPTGAAECLADSYEHLNRPVEAMAVIERALMADADHAGLGLLKSRLLRLSNKHVEGELILRKVLASGKDGSVRWRCFYELGHNLDGQGHYDQALDAFLEAKRILQPSARPWWETWQGMRNRARQLREGLTSEHIARWRAGLPELQPARRLTVLCGQPRSGTTLLEQVLNAHPSIVSTGETFLMHDETYLPLCAGFPPDTPILNVLESISFKEINSARGHYFKRTEEILQTLLGERLVLDKNPSLLALLPAILRIFPEAKFLIALRDPRDVCLSCFTLPLPPNPVAATYMSLETTVQQFESAMNFWLKIRPKIPDGWLEVRYEDTVADLASTARKTLDFLGIEWDEKVLAFHEHARGKILRSPSYSDVVKPVHKRAIGRWRNYQKYFEPYLDRLEPFVKAFGYE